jgi:hypothetical protein
MFRLSIAWAWVYGPYVKCYIHTAAHLQLLFGHMVHPQKVNNVSQTVADIRAGSRIIARSIPPGITLLTVSTAACTHVPV